MINIKQYWEIKYKFAGLLCSKIPSVCNISALKNQFSDRMGESKQRNVRLWWCGVLAFKEV